MTHPPDTEIQPADARVRKAPMKTPAFDLTRERETFMEAKKDFADPRTSVTPTQPQQLSSRPPEAPRDNVSTLSSFLQSCLILLRDQDALTQLQDVIASCGPYHSPVQDKTVHRVNRTGREMRLNAQVGAYHLTDVILDLGSDVNVLTKQTWEQMGNPPLAWSPI